MKEESRKYVQEAYDIVTYAAKKIGSRLQIGRASCRERV